MFEGPKEQSYQPRNKLQTPTKAPQAEVVNQAGASEDVGYKLSENQLKDTKKMFESGGATSPTQSSGSRDESDIVRASDMGSAKKLFEQGEQVDQPEPAPRKQPIDIQQEAMEAVNRDREVQQQEAPATEPPATNEESKESESESEGEYLLDKDQNQGGDAAEEQAAGVTPVRVAVPDSPEPTEEPSYVEPAKEEEKPQEQEQENAYQEEEEEEKEPEVQQQQQEYEAPTEQEVIQDQQEPEEEYNPPAQEEPAEEPEPAQEQPTEASSIVIDDHLIRNEPEQSEEEPQQKEDAYQEEEEQKEQETQQEEEPVKQEETYNNVTEEGSYNDEPTTNGNGYQDEEAPAPDAKDTYAAAPEEESAPVKAPPAAGATENGGLAILQDTDGGSYLE